MAHGCAYRAAFARPGRPMRHERSLHDLVRHETVGRGGVAAYLHLMHQDDGTARDLVAPQVVGALGDQEEADLTGMIDALARRPAVCEVIGRKARSHAAEHPDPERLAARLVEFVASVASEVKPLRRRLAAERAHKATVPGDLLEEVSGAPRELGLAGTWLGGEEPLATLVGRGGR